MKIKLHPKAFDELEHAFHYYKEISNKLAKQFIDEYNNVVNKTQS